MRTEPRSPDATRPQAPWTEPGRWDALGDLAAAAPLPLVVRGECMAPLVPDGARIEVRRSRFLLPGEIVAFLSPSGLLLTHRFLGYTWRRGVRLVTQADRGTQRDALVEPSRVLGRLCGGEVSPEALRPSWRDRSRAVRLWARTHWHYFRRSR